MIFSVIGLTPQLVYDGENFKVTFALSGYWTAESFGLLSCG